MPSSLCISSTHSLSVLSTTNWEGSQRRPVLFEAVRKKYLVILWRYRVIPYQNYTNVYYFLLRGKHWLFVLFFQLFFQLKIQTPTLGRCVTCFQKVRFFNKKIAKNRSCKRVMAYCVYCTPKKGREGGFSKSFVWLALFKLSTLPRSSCPYIQNQ